MRKCDIDGQMLFRGLVRPQIFLCIKAYWPIVVRMIAVTSRLTKGWTSGWGKRSIPASRESEGGAMSTTPKENESFLL